VVDQNDMLLRGGTGFRRRPEIDWLRLNHSASLGQEFVPGIALHCGWVASVKLRA
jgi:hypothetical protein